MFSIKINIKARSQEMSRPKEKRLTRDKVDGKIFETCNL